MRRRNTRLARYAWPELFEDLDIRFVRGSRKLRTQTDILHCSRIVAGHGHQGISASNSTTAPGGRLDHPIAGATLGCWLRVEFDPTLFTCGTRDCRRSGRSDRSPDPPVTLRTEWLNPARNPKPEYVNTLAAELMATHTVVVVASLAEGRESWLEPAASAPPFSSLVNCRSANRFALVRMDVGRRRRLIVPAALALKTRAFVLGGHGGHNAPEKITDLDWIEPHRFAMPEDYCDAHICRTNARRKSRT
jgi:hypothetical protein